MSSQLGQVSITILLICIIGAQAQSAPSSNSNNSSCKLNLANNVTSAQLRQQFQDVAQTGKFVVYFHLWFLGSDGVIRSFNASTGNTFMPGLWVWSTPKGKNLLRMPLDYGILSLGLLKINTRTMNVMFDQATEDCVLQQNYSDTAHLVAKFIAEDITVNGTTVGVDKEGPVVCRSSYAFSHAMFGERGIGFRCCAAPFKPGDPYVCESSYAQGWELVWFGPIVLMCWVYSIAIIHFYKLYRKRFDKQKIRELSGLEHTIDEIKLDIINRFVTISKRFIRIQDTTDIVALRESIGFLDVVGVDKTRQSKVIDVFTVIVLTFLVSAYYVIYAMFIYAYKLSLLPELRHLQDSRSVYLNVLGHMGWLFADSSRQIFHYAIFEAVYTCLLPFFAVILIVSLEYRDEAKNLAIANQKSVAPASMAPASINSDPQDVVPSPLPAQPPSINYGGCKKALLLFVISPFGNFIQGISFFLCFIHLVLIGGVFFTYLIYFVGLGIFANIAVVSPWVIPLGICIHFFITVFDPAVNLYKQTKDMFFSICMESFKELVIRRRKEIFIPRVLIEAFYIPRSKPVLYTCLLRIMWVIAFMFLLVLLILTLQYPYYHETDSIVSFLGVQVVFILPLLAQIMLGSQPLNSLEQAILQSDMRQFIKKYIKEHPEIIPPPKQKRPTSQGEGDGGNENKGPEDNGGEGEEMGEIHPGYPSDDGNIDLNALVTGGRQILARNGYRSQFI